MDTTQPPTSAETGDATGAAMRELVGMFWDSPFPTTVQDETHRLVAVNDAFVQFTGYPRERLIGSDPVQLQPPDDRERSLERRRRHAASPEGRTAPLVDQRLVDAAGRTRWFRAARRELADAGGGVLHLSVLQDCTPEHAAREQADRSARDLDQWFDIARSGMLLFDDAGLLLRTNPAFEVLVGALPVTLAEAPPRVQELLAWDGDAPNPRLEPGAAPVERSVWLEGAGGASRRLRALVRCYKTPTGQRRYMAAVDDLSVEEERDLARLQIGAMAETAGVGVATFRESGWMSAGPTLRPPPDAPGLARNGGVHAISREMVVEETLSAYEAVQQALRRGERAEQRYAVRHPELGLRWLLTRVEPGQLASGKRTLSVVTLDVTDQQQARLHNEQLLRELGTILESSPAGIVYLRGEHVVRCNHRFERMIGAEAGAAMGCSVRELFADVPTVRDTIDALVQAIADGQPFEAEFQAQRGGGAQKWWSLVVRSEHVLGAPGEAVGMLSDITRLKAQQTRLEALAREREFAEASLLRQADRTRAMLDSVLVGIVTVGRDGIAWMNRSARRMFAGELADFIGRPLATVATPEPDHPFRRTHYLDELVEGQAATFECRVKARDAREFWVAGNAVVTLQQQGERELTYALLDIDRRRQAEVRIAEAQASLQRIIEMAPLAITLHDAATLQVLQANPAVEALTGRPAAQAIGCKPAELFEPGLAGRMCDDMRAACAAALGARHEYRVGDGVALRVWDARMLPLAASGSVAEQLLLVATDVTEQRAAEQARLDAAIAQREMLVKEVHHRIKNNLQGVAGLLQQAAARRPEVAPILADVGGQVQAIAQIYGLQVGAAGPLRVKSVVDAIAGAVQRTFGRDIEQVVDGAQAHRWALPEAESIPIALTLNELLNNAVKHGEGGAAIRCTLYFDADGVRIVIENAGRLPAGFDLARVPGGVSGLGLVRALLPRRSAALAIEQDGARVVTTIALRPPGVTYLTRL